MKLLRRAWCHLFGHRLWMRRESPTSWSLWCQRCNLVETRANVRIA